MPQVEDDAAVFRAGAFTQLERALERIDLGEGHQFIGDPRTALFSLPAQLCEFLDQLRHGHLGAEKVADLDVTPAKRFGGVEEPAPRRIRVRAPLARFQEPVREEFDLDVLHPVRIEDLPHFLQRPRLRHVLQIGVPQSEPLEAGSRRLLHAGLELEGAVFPIRMRQCPAGEGPVGGDQLDLAHGCIPDRRCARIRLGVHVHACSGRVGVLAAL